MIAKEFVAVTKEDVESLVINAVSEGRSLEYKELLPAPGNADDTKEFLADVSSFANSSGGDLIFGIRAKDGVPEAAEGLAGVIADKEILRLENILRDAVDPRIQGIQIKSIEGFQAGPVILVRIPKSWAAPHMVKFKNASRFFTRTSAGKHQKDVREIRSAFVASESLTERIATFRSERVGKVLAGDTPALVEPLPKVVLHLLPIQAFSEPQAIDLTEIRKTWAKIEPMGFESQHSSLQFNFNGLFVYGGGPGIKPVLGYTQIFRNGAMEAVYGCRTSGKLLFGIEFERQLMRAGAQYIKFLEQLEVGPMFLALSLISAKGLMVVNTFTPSTPFAFHGLSFIRDDVLLAPETLNDEKDGDIRKLLRRPLDSIWQASAWAGSPGYDEAGEWIGHKSY